MVSHHAQLGRDAYTNNKCLSSAFRVYRVQADLDESGTAFAKTNAYGRDGDKIIEGLGPSTLEGHAESYGYQLGLGDRITPAAAAGRARRG